MNSTLDKFGRVAVPKATRERLGWRDGTRLALEVHEGRLVLTAEDTTALLRERDGVLVYGGAADGDVAGALEKLRDERLRKVGRG